MKQMERWITATFVILIFGLLLAGCTSSSVAIEKVDPARLEPIEGSDFSRVILTEKAAERVDIQTVPVREEQILRRLAAAGQVMAPGEPAGAGSASATTSVVTAATGGAMLVRVRLNESDLMEVDLSQPARILSLDDEEDSDEEDEEGLAAEPDEGMADDDPEENALYYVLDSAEHDIAPGQPVLVELNLLGDETLRKVVPYAAVLYGVHGETWVYTNPEPLVFIRQPIVIDYIEEDLAILSEGPEVGTAVVTLGAEELFGTETGVSK